MKSYIVEPISYHEAKPWIIKKHYAKRMPAVQHSFGLFNGGYLEGVIAYGPTCRSLNRGYGAFGGDLDVNSFELLRLCIESENKNAASILISKSIKYLPTPSFLVSYADANQGHVGYVYQATNWIYCGITSKERKYVRNGKELHARTVVSMFGSRKLDALPYDIEIEEQEGKHRYIYFHGTRSQKKEMISKLRYNVYPYPKGESKKYDASAEFHKQMRLF